MMSDPIIPTGGNDYHRLPTSEKQLQFARQIARRLGQAIPQEAQQDRRTLSRWIDDNRIAAQRQAGRFGHYPTSKQVAFAERIARVKRRHVPDECFRDKGLMSRWIDSNI